DSRNERRKRAGGGSTERAATTAVHVATIVVRSTVIGSAAVAEPGVGRRPVGAAEGGPLRRPRRSRRRGRAAERALGVGRRAGSAVERPADIAEVELGLERDAVVLRE